MKKYFALIALLLPIIFFVSGCGSSDDASDPISADQTISDEDQIAFLGELKNSISSKEDEAVVVALVDENIAALSPAHADEAVRMLDKYLNDKVSARGDEFFYGEPNIQELFYQEFDGKEFVSIGLDQMEIEDEKLSELIKITYDRGYIVTVAEGTFFPVVDYSSMRMYMPYVTPAMSEYIAFLALDTEDPSNEDAGLLISFDEVYQRALQAEKYLNKYPEVPEADVMENNLKFYITAYIYGLNNTPVFDYTSNEAVPDARASYEALSLDDQNSRFQNLLMEYLKILKKNNYVLTPEVDVARKVFDDAFALNDYGAE